MVYKRSDRVVAREIEGELILLPLKAGIGNLEDELYAFNDTGAAIWRKFDGVRTLGDIARELSNDFDAPVDMIYEAVAELARDLAVRGLVVSANS